MIQKGDSRIQFANMLVLFLIGADAVLLIVLFLLFGPVGLLRLIGDFETISPLPEIALFLLILFVALKLLLHLDERYALLLENNSILIQSRLPFLSRKLETEEISKINSLSQKDTYSIETQNEIFKVFIPKEKFELLRARMLSNER